MNGKKIDPYALVAPAIDRPGQEIVTTPNLFGRHRSEWEELAEALRQTAFALLRGALLSSNIPKTGADSNKSGTIDMQRGVHITSGLSVLLYVSGDDTVRVQFDDIEHAHAIGWHTYPGEDFKIIPKSQEPQPALRK